MEVLRTFINIDSEDFGANGEAMYHGSAYLVKAGESKVFTEKLARHLAGALAYKIANKTGKFSPEAMEETVKKIIGMAVFPQEVPVAAVETPVAKDEPKEEEFVIKPKKVAKKATKKIK